MGRKQVYGFTLIEVMIVVTIIAIISAIAYPSYAEHVRKSRRADAQIALQELVRRQENYHVRENSYAGSLEELSYAASTMDSPEGFYTLSIGSKSPASCDGTRNNPCTGFVAVAAPKAGGPQVHDEKCQRMTMDHLGRKKASDNATQATDTSAECW